MRTERTGTAYSSETAVYTRQLIFTLVMCKLRVMEDILEKSVVSCYFISFILCNGKLML